MSPEQDPFDKILGDKRAEAEREQVAAADLERRNGLRYQAIKERGRVLAEMLKPTLDKSVSALQAAGLPKLGDVWGYEKIESEVRSAEHDAKAHRFKTARREIALPLMGDSGLKSIIAVTCTKGLVSSDKQIEPVGWQVAKRPSSNFVSTVEKEFSPEFPIKEPGYDDGPFLRSPDYVESSRDSPDARNGGSYNLLNSSGFDNELLWAKLHIPARGTARVALTKRARNHGITEYPGFIEHTEYTPSSWGPHYSFNERYKTHSEGRASLYAGAIEAITSYLANK